MTRRPPARRGSGPPPPPPPGHVAPPGYDPREFPPFAVTVDVVILTLLAGRLHVLLVQRAADPYAGCWALPGGFKRPRETLDEAAARELREETGVEAAAHLSQLGAYGDPGRDPRTNVVTVAYIAVLRELQHVVAGGDAARAQLRPVDEAVRGRLELAFDHRRILEDALERTRRNLETTDLATAFVGPAFTLSELRGVFEAVWETTYDPGNFHRKLTGESGWLKATGERARPGPGGGKPSERYRAGRAWEKGAPFRRPRQRAASAR